MTHSFTLSQCPQLPFKDEKPAALTQAMSSETFLNQMGCCPITLPPDLAVPQQ